MPPVRAAARFRCPELVVLLAAVLFALPVHTLALGPTLPSDMFTYEVTGSLTGEGYVFLDPQGSLGINGSHCYLLTVNGQGEIVHYAKPKGPYASNWQPVDSAGVFTVNMGDPNHPVRTAIYDRDLTLITSIDSENPDNDSLSLDGHELLVEADGSTWSLWRHEAVIDMSEYAAGGQPNAVVIGHDIEKRSPDGQLLWAWRSHEHIDQVPYTGMTNPWMLTWDVIEYMHVNSIDLTPDGDVLISARAMSVVIKIDYDTGDVEWIIGRGPLNQFVFFGDNGDDPLDFAGQHDARMLNDSTLTVYDNGTFGPTPRSFGREYHLDVDAREATLTWAWSHPLGFAAQVMGSYRRLPTGDHLFGWGGAGPMVRTTWLDPDDNLLLELNFNAGPWSEPSVYRATWSPDPPVAARPSVSDVVEEDQGTVELVCNWWGHEDEVYAFEVYIGTVWDPPLHGVTDTGVYYADGYQPNVGYVVRCRALDADGNAISELSDRLLIDPQFVGVDEPIVSRDATLPTVITLSPAWPNPFNSSAQFTLTLPAPASLTVSLHNLLGQQVMTLHNGPLSPGQHRFTVNARHLASGCYILRAADGSSYTAHQRITLVR